MNAILRIETLFGKLVPIYDASHLIKEKKLNDLKFFKLTDLLNKNSLFLGFGKPNVFLAFPNNDSFFKFDAKSLKREPSKIVDTRNIAQSGLLFLFNNPTEDMLNSIKKAALEESGSKNWTCVNSNCKVLERAGFSSGDIPLSDFYFPIKLAKHIINNGLYFKGEKVELIFIRTVPNYLENFGFSVGISEWNTPYRHLKRLLREKRKNNSFLKYLNDIKNKFFIKNNKEKKIIEDKTIVFPDNIKPKGDFDLIVSEPSKFGVLLRILWGPHAFFEIKNKSNKIETLLPEKLKEYQQKNKGIITNIKKHILFSKPVIRFIRMHLNKNQELFENSSEKDLYNMLRTHTKNKPHKYNLVITGSALSIIKIDIKYGLIDWILSKHVLLSGYSDDVRYAGEFWKGEDGIIYFNNNSGTYAPDSNSVERTKLFLDYIFPNIKIIPVKFE